MAMYEWSETFMSVEGEAKYTGVPTAYIRFTKCNFQCKGFNNPEKLDTTSVAVLGFQPRDYKTIYDIPLIHKGCDSIYSWDEKFSHMWSKGDEQVLTTELVNLLPNKNFRYKSGQHASLSLTGGEPTLRFKFWIPLLTELKKHDLNHIIVETNCAVPLNASKVEEFLRWCHANNIFVTWSNSPKLSVSGEAWDDAIKPQVALNQIPESVRHLKTAEQYFKFVCGDSDEDFAEVEKAMNQYWEAGVSRTIPVYIMPVACQVEDQTSISAAVARRCIERGWIYCHRVHLDVFGNGVGT